MQLPKAQRLRLVDQLWDSIEGEESQEPVDLEPELRAELLRRLKAIEDGTALLLDGDEVMHELRAKLSASTTRSSCSPSRITSESLATGPSAC